MFNLTKESDRNKLFQAMNLSYLKLEPFRLLNTGLVEEYAGSHYGYETVRPRYETMLNLMNQAVDAYIMQLVANRPTVMAETNDIGKRFFARHYAEAINNMLQEIRIEEVLRSWVRAAFFSIGLVKVHLADVGPVEMWDAQKIDPGTPFASNVSLDDWVHDMSASRWDQVQFEGDCYRVALDDLKADSRFDQKVVKTLVPSSKRNTAGWAERTEMLSKGYQTDQDEIMPMVDIMDVFIKREQKIYTFAMNPAMRFYGQMGPLAVMDWDGPEAGPYHKLSFDEVPDNTMPIGPAAHLAALARLANSIMRKQSRQARRQKDVHTYTAAGAEDAKKIQRTNDGDWVAVNDTKEVGVMKMGGVDASNQQFLIHVIEMYDRMAGNLPALLGLGPQADTLGQEQLVVGAASKKAAMMQMRCLEASRGLVRNLAYMLWTDAAKTIPGRLAVPGVAGASIASKWTPEFRMGEFHDYDLDIDVFSMPYQPPEKKASSLLQLLETVYVPMQQQMAQQGGQINIQALTDTLAELMHLPRLKEIVQFSTPQPGDQGAADSSPGMPASTTRSYVRRSVPASGTPQARNQAQSQAWSGLAAQQTSGSAPQGNAA